MAVAGPLGESYPQIDIELETAQGYTKTLVAGSGEGDVCRRMIYKVICSTNGLLEYRAKLKETEGNDSAAPAPARRPQNFGASEVGIRATR